MEWWVTHGDRAPIGPVTTELLLQGIGAGMIPRDSLVCEVGGTEWRPIRKTAPFSIALDGRQSRRDPDDEHTIADAPDDSLNRFDEVVEHTIVDYPRVHSSIPPRLNRTDRPDDFEERTITDIVPLPSSEPPNK
jgi:hypothetical protein